MKKVNRLYRRSIDPRKPVFVNTDFIHKYLSSTIKGYQLCNKDEYIAESSKFNNKLVYVSDYLDLL